MIYRNPYSKKIRRSSQLIIISCGHCKTDLALYQKVGRGGLQRMYLERILKSSIDLSDAPGTLLCPNCKRQLATKVYFTRKNKEAYQLIRAVFNVRPLK